jgi:hypothetical protein
MNRGLFLAVCFLAGATACEREAHPDRDAVEHFHANTRAFDELNRTVGELPDDILSLEPGSEFGTVRLRRKPVNQDLLTEESTAYSTLLESFENLDLALISRSGGYAVFHRNAIDDGGAKHFFEYISQPVKNESMRCESHEKYAQSIRSCLVDLDREWSMWIKTLPSAELRDRLP